MADLPSDVELRMRVIEALAGSRNIAMDYLLPMAVIVARYVTSGEVTVAAHERLKGAEFKEPLA